jgi:hypothetical protein
MTRNPKPDSAAKAQLTQRIEVIIEPVVAELAKLGLQQSHPAGAA